MADSPLVDLFPARVTFEVGAHPAFRDKARVIVLPDRLLVFVEDAQRQVSLAFDEPIVSAGRPVPNRLSYDVQLADGRVWTITRGTGCGCGSTLKRARQLDLLEFAAAPVT